MREIQEPKSLRLTTKKSTPKRERYWAKVGGKPTRKIQKRPGMLKRLARTNILDTVSSLSSIRLEHSGVFAQMRQDILRQKLSGTLRRLKRQNPFSLTIPPKLERLSQASAFKSQEEKRKS